MVCNSYQFFQDATVLRRLGFPAKLPQTLELFFQLPQFANARGDVPDVCIQQRIDLATVLGRCIPEMQKSPDFAERHVQTAAMPDER